MEEQLRQIEAEKSSKELKMKKETESLELEAAVGALSEELESSAVSPVQRQPTLNTNKPAGSSGFKKPLAKKPKIDFVKGSTEFQSHDEQKLPAKSFNTKKSNKFSLTLL